MATRTRRQINRYYDCKCLLARRLCDYIFGETIKQIRPLREQFFSVCTVSIVVFAVLRDGFAGVLFEIAVHI